MTTVHKWRIHCSTEPADYYIWDTDTPTVCPTDAGHTILEPMVVQTVDEKSVSLVEEKIPTDGSFYIDGFVFENFANITTDNFVSFPFPINAMALEMSSMSGTEDDHISVIVGENTIVGVLMAPSSATDITFTTTAATVVYLSIGIKVSLYDGVNTDILGRIISVDRVLNTFTVETAAVNAFSAVTTYIRISKVVVDAPIGPSGTHSWGEAKIGGSYIPANVNIIIRYTNNHATDMHKIYGYIQYLA